MFFLVTLWSSSPLQLEDNPEVERMLHVSTSKHSLTDSPTKRALARQASEPKPPPEPEARTERQPDPPDGGYGQCALLLLCGRAPSSCEWAPSTTSSSLYGAGHIAPHSISLCELLSDSEAEAACRKSYQILILMKEPCGRLLLLAFENKLLSFSKKR